MKTILRLTKDDMTDLGQPAPIGAFSYSEVMHDVGVLQVTIGKEWAKYIDFEYRIECLRAIPHYGLVMIRSYFIEGIEEVTDRQSRDLLLITALDANALLGWRDIEAKAGSANATKTDHADDLMKAYVMQQLGAGIDPLPYTFFDVDADHHLGPILTVENAWANLLQACQSISDESEGAGNRVYFRIRDSFANSAEVYFFEAAPGLIGVDHSITSAMPLRVGLGYGNVSAIRRIRDASEEVNHVISAGSGQDEARLIGESIGAGATRNLWSRKKLVYNESQLNTTTALNSAAARRVAAGKPRDRIAATLVDAPGFTFGLDWRFGDKLTVEHKHVAYTGIVKAITWNVAENGHETIDCKLEVEA